MPGSEPSRLRLALGLALGLALVALAGCQLPLDHAACPCAEGWVCCPTSNICVAGTGDHCPGGSAGPNDAREPDGSPPGGGGGAEIQRLQLDHGWTGDHFGGAVALVGELAAIGAPGRDGAVNEQGAVVLFERRGGGTGIWVQVAVLTAPDPAFNSGFGETVTFSGDAALLVGAPRASGAGRVYLFRRVDGRWSWQQTLAPDAPDDQTASLQFGALVSTDAGRALVGARKAAQLYDITPAGATHAARLELPDGGICVAVALHGSSAVIVSTLQSATVYDFEQALGWAAPTPVTGSLGSPTSLAFDGDRLAIAHDKDSVRILERTGSSWGASADIALPIDPTATRPLEPGWHGGELIMTAQLSPGVLGLLRLRSVGGAWQLDPIQPLAEPLASNSQLVASGDRAMVGLPFASVAGINPGQVAVFHLDAAGVTAESTIGFDEPPLLGDGVIAARSGHVLASAALGDRAIWFEQHADGHYQRRPSLVLESNIEIVSPVAVAGSHALVAAQHAHTPGAVPWVQSFELGALDWIAGPSLAAPEQGLGSFAASLAVDGDIAAITAERLHSVAAPSAVPNGVVFVYAWSSAGWALEATLDTGLVCAPSVVIAGARMAVFCSNVFRLFERTGSTWYQIPTPVVPEPGQSIVRLVFSGEMVAIASAATDGYVVSDVFRWTDGHWHGELHVRSDRLRTGCSVACRFGVAAVTADRLVVYRDATSLARYRFTDGAWLEQPPLELPPSPRSPDAFVQAAVLTSDGVIASVASEGDGINPRAGALYGFPWR